MVKSCGQIFGGGSLQFLFSLLLVFLVIYILFLIFLLRKERIYCYALGVDKLQYALFMARISSHCCFL
jgi:hypothetical protein